MRDCKRRDAGLDLERAAVKFARWRQGRKRGERIPAPLWELALQLASRHGLSRTVAALSLDYYTLKKRVEQQPAPAVSAEQSPAQPAFVELAPLAVSPPSQCLVEFQNAAGSTVRVYLPAGQVPDLIALARSFGGAR
jgi:hypothetical protein